MGDRRGTVAMGVAVDRCIWLNTITLRPAVGPTITAMTMMIIVAAVLGLAQSMEAGDATTKPIPSVTMVTAIPNHTYREPVQILSMPGRDDVLVIVERGGRVLMSPLGGKGKDELFLDLRNRLTTSNSEEGLLSLAFDPKLVDHTSRLYMAIHEEAAAEPIVTVYSFVRWSVDRSRDRRGVARSG